MAQMDGWDGFVVGRCGAMTPSRATTMGRREGPCGGHPSSTFQVSHCPKHFSPPYFTDSSASLEEDRALPHRVTTGRTGSARDG